MRDGFAQVDGATVHYVELGQGTPLVLVHGWGPGSTWRVWEANMEALATHHRVIAVDLPGYGESPAPGAPAHSDPDTFSAQYARYIGALVDSLALAPVALIGLSAGGGIALHVASRRPDSVDRLVLVDSSGSAAGERWRTIVMPTLIIWQREDEVIPLADGEALHRAIAGSRMEVLEGNAAGGDDHRYHWPQALNPDRFNELVNGFLDGYGYG